MRKSIRPSKSPSFARFYEQRFRRSPIVIGLGLLLTGFGAGFTAHQELARPCASLETFNCHFCDTVMAL